MKCRFGCPDYGRRRTCPPLAPTIGEFRAVLTDYQTALLVWVEAGGGDDLHRTRRRLHEAILTLEREAFLAGAYKAFGLVDGTCLWCADEETCTPAACRHPDKVRPSLSGCGVDAFATAAAAGVQMHIVRDHAEAYRLLGLVLIAKGRAAAGSCKTEPLRAHASPRDDEQDEAATPVGGRHAPDRLRAMGAALLCRALCVTRGP
jgi:predicted metal-binding protein